jgi:hypothetical protein
VSVDATVLNSSLTKLTLAPVHDAAHLSLVTFAYTKDDTRDVLLRMVLTPNAASARGLLYALLAVSSLHRHGLCQEALSYKIAALRALSTSVTNVTKDTSEATQHVAASMLLCAFEVSNGMRQPDVDSTDRGWHRSWNQPTALATGYAIFREPST